MLMSLVYFAREVSFSASQLPRMRLQLCSAQKLLAWTGAIDHCSPLVVVPLARALLAAAELCARRAIAS